MTYGKKLYTKHFPSGHPSGFITLIVVRPNKTKRVIYRDITR